MQQTERGPDRRHENRRADPNVWSPAHLRQVQMLYGFVVGGLLVFAGIVVLIYAVSGDHAEWYVLGMGGGLVLMGLVAGLPRTFMPVFSSILKRLPFLKSEPANGSITRAMIRIESDISEEE